MLTYGDKGLRLHSFLTSSLISKWSASSPISFIPREKDWGSKWAGGWVGPSQVWMLPRTEGRGSTLDCPNVHRAEFTARSGDVDFVCPSTPYLFTVPAQWNFAKNNQACEIQINADQGSSVLERCVMAICKELTDVSAECSSIFKNIPRSSETSVTPYQSIWRSCQKDLIFMSCPFLL